MKILHILIAFASLFIIGCAANSAQTAPSQPSSTAISSIGGISIISAT